MNYTRKAKHFKGENMKTKVDWKGEIYAVVNHTEAHDEAEVVFFSLKDAKKKQAEIKKEMMSDCKGILDYHEICKKPKGNLVSCLYSTEDNFFIAIFKLSVENFSNNEKLWSILK